MFFSSCVTFTYKKRNHRPHIFSVEFKSNFNKKKTYNSCPSPIVKWHVSVANSNTELGGWFNPNATFGKAGLVSAGTPAHGKNLTLTPNH